MVHWHQTTAKHPRLSAGAATSPPGGSHHSDSTSTSTSSRQDRTSDHEDHEEQLLPFQQQQQEAGRAGGSSSDGGSEAPCEHVACSRLTFCLVEEMERLKRNYHGRADQVCCTAFNLFAQGLSSGPYVVIIMKFRCFWRGFWHGSS